MAPFTVAFRLFAAAVLIDGIVADPVVSRAPSGAYRFAYEKKTLTDEAVAQLSSEEQKLFGFDDRAVGAGLSRGSRECKVYPGDADWPMEKTWDRFDELVDGALIPTIPLASACYKNWGVYDPAKCAAIAKSFTDPYLHEADPTSNMWPIFQGKTCLAFDRPNGTCSLGSYPTYAVNVSSVAHIQLALNFARNANLRLVIKNTGHDYLGKSLGAGALSIWTHNLKNIDFVENYKSDSGYEGSALKVGAGATVREVYQVADKHGVTALGGICESVGYAGGYVAGGGHTPMSGYYGMAADNVEALEVVTADGRFVTASNSSNPDLYWALRGGGGGTFGVATSVIIRAHPKMPIVTSVFSFKSGGNITNEIFWQGLRKYFEMFIPFTDAHTYSYFWIWATNGTLEFQMTPFFAPNHTIKSFNELVKPWFDHLHDLGIDFTPNTTLHDSFYPAYNANWGHDMVAGINAIPGNRLFPRGNWEDPEKFEKTFAAIRDHSMKGKSLGGYHQAPRNRLNIDNAVSSAFRHVITFLIGAAIVENAENATSADMAKAVDVLTNDVLGPWRAVSPESDFGGSYLNEANVMEPNWQQSFYGVQYPRLLELKKKWDPKSVFYAPTAVGSEEWEVQDGDQGTQTQNGRLCKVQEAR
ncbi:FAD/FMN-containing isoamyl alcohol oxidase-like protein MreA [Lentithecium fluviatile CBS 122367]|uniref:FAD/FMN-containing isoamyl alcohol oxidase-like protein MreA n=1 Tax=Lentithecium fluviatile CBS 122367 TaxID=1168545 RepID=A0A6G1IZ12_9PLEO|nr:FAD/FMN-containing isoamyl alcohol oxidase-like protein MreA [Lentithecium fluviatile CBS 122367]